MSTPTPDLAALKLRQQATWASGDYSMVGTTIQIIAETLCEAVDLRAGWQVLDVAAGSGNASLAAARRWCRVTSTDYVPALLEKGRRRAEADQLPIVFQEADAENLPFPDASFDAALSTVGVMFAPNHAKAASELRRVVKPGGRIGLANWTPASFVGQTFKAISKYAPPPAGVQPAMLWGTKEHLDTLFATATSIQAKPRNFIFRYLSAEHWLDVFRSFYGPMHKTFAALAPEAQTALAADLIVLANQANISGDATLVIPGEYLEIVITV